MVAAALPASVELLVPRRFEGDRLDRFLAQALAELPYAPSRSELQRWVEHGRVTVDGVVAAKAGERLREGAKLIVLPMSPPQTTAVAEDGIAFDVLYSDESVVVVMKPAGLVVHPALGHHGGTLVNGLLARGFFTDESVLHDDGSDAANFRPGIVHRLDKGTSGVMVVARTATARELLKAEFACHTIDREYEAICVGDVAPGTISTLHARHPKERLKFTSRVTEGKRAVTHIEVIAKLGPVTHVVCRLETGRTHQIRVHLAETGTPILGDPLYGRTPSDPRLRALAETLGRQALHARLLGFTHPVSGAPMRFTSPPPADFTRVLLSLRA